MQRESGKFSRKFFIFKKFTEHRDNLNLDANSGAYL